MRPRTSSASSSSCEFGPWRRVWGRLGKVVALARVTQDLDEPRGPDVACSIEVPENWFWVGATLQIALPRLLSCARCDGGGCDACERRGAFEQAAAGTAREVAVVLPVLHPERCVPVRLRLPALGARAAEQG